MGIRGPVCSVILGQALAIRDCAGCGGRCWPQARPWTPTVRRERSKRISLRFAQCEQATMRRVPRLAAVFGGLQQAHSNRLPIAVAVRSPPSEPRASPRPRSRANQDLAFCVDRVLRSHSGCRARCISTPPSPKAHVRHLPDMNDYELGIPRTWAMKKQPHAQAVRRCNDSPSDRAREESPSRLNGPRSRDA
jgi:hypothetical protein